MSAIKDKDSYVQNWTHRINELLIVRNNLTPAELEDLAVRVDKLRDEKLKEYMATLMGWGHEERAELVVFCTLALSAMRELRPSKLRELAERIEMKYYLTKEAKK